MRHPVIQEPGKSSPPPQTHCKQQLLCLNKKVYVGRDLSFLIEWGSEGSRWRWGTERCVCEGVGVGNGFPKEEAGQHRVNWILRWLCINKGQQSVFNSPHIHTQTGREIPHSPSWLTNQNQYMTNDLRNQWVHQWWYQDVQLSLNGVLSAQEKAVGRRIYCCGIHSCRVVLLLFGRLGGNGRAWWCVQLCGMRTDTSM